jgi:hypothetical protein
MLEAECRKCGETFIPQDEDDLIHIERSDGTECGGECDIIRWVMTRHGWIEVQ